MEPISPSDLNDAIEDLSICEFFPSTPAAQAAIMRLLHAICPHRDALRWLVDAFVNRIGRWHGPVELRAVLATRFRPADGIEAYSTIPGFSVQDSESAVMEQHEQLKSGSWDSDDEIDQMLKRLSANNGM